MPSIFSYILKKMFIYKLLFQYIFFLFIYIFISEFNLLNFNYIGIKLKIYSIFKFNYFEKNINILIDKYVFPISSFSVLHCFAIPFYSNFILFALWMSDIHALNWQIHGFSVSQEIRKYNAQAKIDFWRHSSPDDSILSYSMSIVTIIHYVFGWGISLIVPINGILEKIILWFLYHI